MSPPTTVATGPRQPSVLAARSARLRGPAGVAVAAAVAVAYLGSVDPNRSGHYPTCPFYFLTGHYCPGCGSLRALHSLAHGDVAGMLAHNALLVACLPVLAGIWLGYLRRSWRGVGRRRPAPAWSVWAGLVVVLAFTVVRNLPVGAALAP